MPASSDFTHIPTDASRLMIKASFPRLAPARFIDHWTRPELLALWWPASAQVDARPGGQYHLAWPAMKWDLRGEYTRFEPPRRLAFTWRWDHEPSLPTRKVDLTIAPDGGGSGLTLVHGDYDASQRDQDDRVSHLEGWRYFLARLQTL